MGFLMEKRLRIILLRIQSSLKYKKYDKYNIGLTNFHLQFKCCLHRLIFIIQIDSEIMYQLKTPGEMSNRSNSPFIDKQMNEEGPVQERQCTDIVCLVLFFLFLGAFIGILIYAVVTGSPTQAISIHNVDGVACYKNSNFPNGFFPNSSSPTKAVCVAKCPEQKQQTVSCLTDSDNCPSGSITSTYGTFQILTYCVLDPTISGQSLADTFNVKLIVQWIFDVQKGYYVLIGAVVLSIIIVVLYTCLLRCITACLLYSSFVVIQIILVGVGILLILQGSGIPIGETLPINLANLGTTELYIAGGVLLAIGLLFILVIVCMCNKIKLGVAIVETASTFVSQRFYMLLMPVISTIFFFAALAAIVTGGLYLYGTGQRTLEDGNGFYTIDFNVGLIIMNVVFGFAGLWLVFWIFYSNVFVIMSAACIWYYKQDSPLCTSFGRLLRFHSGSISLTSFLFGYLFILRLIAKFFYLRNQQYSNKCLQYTIKVVTFCFCIFDLLLKFLSQGVYVQIAVKGTNYCSSTINAFGIITSNPLKLALAGGISYLVGIIGVVFTTAIACGAAYLVQVYVPAFNGVLTDPVPMTVISGIAVVIVSAIFLSILSDSSEALIQCYVMDQTSQNAKGGKAKFVPETLRIIFQEHTQI